MSYMRQRVLTHDRWLFGGVATFRVAKLFSSYTVFLCVPSTLLLFLFKLVFLRNNATK